MFQAGRTEGDETWKPTSLEFLPVYVTAEMDTMFHACFDATLRSRERAQSFPYAIEAISSINFTGALETKTHCSAPIKEIGCSPGGKSFPCIHPPCRPRIITFCKTLAQRLIPDKSPCCLIHRKTQPAFHVPDRIHSYSTTRKSAGAEARRNLL